MSETTYRIRHSRAGDIVGTGATTAIATNVCAAPPGSRFPLHLRLIRPRGMVRR